MANYAESLLAHGERVVKRAHQHWFVFVYNARWAILALLGALVLLVARVWLGDSGTLWQVLSWVTLAVFLFGVLSFLWSILRYRNEEYLITTRRLIHVEGVINKKTTDSSLEKINDAVLTESVFGRMFGFGDLDVLTASEQGIERLRMLRDAKDFKKAMIEAKHELEVEVARPVMPPLRSEPAVEAPAYEPAPAPAPMAAAPVAAPAPAPVAGAPTSEPAADDIGDALARIGDLRDRGLITPEEYAAKRAELLDRL
jgi:membrane protein YdbS with pleckstrin-like domain